MVYRHRNMFLLVMILSVCGFTVAEERHLLCSSEDIDILYSNCSRGLQTKDFSLKIEPCSLKGRSVWRGSLFWIPRADLTILRAHVNIWSKGFESVKWKGDLCKGVDDGYTFCGALKGETINTTVRFSGREPTFEEGEYTIVVKGFAGHHKELIACLNYTIIIKQPL
ncbi:lymphocyte antigen 96 isoform X1 [Lacerta agilis]|uniref:lymphocyte antigen 96 isoform X1 n=1 Tax=Lacerta agilis TaxID=80427 RepID=UPI001419E27E|nr:lymphocyte antigen 96 isoform X1 [Lacerta agilis]